MSYYWGVVKDMDDSQKLELVTMLIESVKPKITAAPPMKRYTMDDINAMIDEAERQIAAGETIPDEEVWRKYDEEYPPPRLHAGVPAASVWSRSVGEDEMSNKL